MGIERGRSLQPDEAWICPKCKTSLGAEVTEKCPKDDFLKSESQNAPNASHFVVPQSDSELKTHTSSTPLPNPYYTKCQSAPFLYLSYHTQTLTSSTIFQHTLHFEYPVLPLRSPTASGTEKTFRSNVRAIPNVLAISIPLATAHTATGTGIP
ncbi:hypothetical protein CC80DRAFT_547255 [Byssothecium circinans]|uniref:Uncharacterized protein n=1 Tax=Byssothecium circinans TaxID=147558 RepID=A0A6A5TYD1_9PLEO|nr:hypothetical protein CC80DRAFT_547255 [Byssothecium circinans]